MAAETDRKERIYLTGFMGSGKSTIGPILANSLGWSFVDLDRAVELSSGRTVSEIFQELGEAAFRMKEREILHETGRARQTVVALGGGTIAGEENLRFVTKSGILVYLRIPPDQLFQRLRKKTNRPMLGGAGTARLDEPELRSRVAELHRVREPYYRMADIVIETGTQPVGLTVDEVVRKLIPLIS